MAPGPVHPALTLAAAESVVFPQLLVIGCGLFSHVCSVNSPVYRMFA